MMNELASARVEIAKDALAQIRAGKIRPEKGTFGFFPHSFMEQHGAERIQTAIDLQDFKCEACALGSLMIGFAYRHNDVRVRELQKSAQLRHNGPLGDFFDYAQLALIEEAFEGWDRGGLWYYKYANDEERLIAILENIVANNGTFVYEGA